MRILLALDGSTGAETAHALVRSLPWPASTRIDAVRVVEPAFDLFMVPGVQFDAPMDDLLGVTEVRHALDADVSDLRSGGLEVASHVVVGRPATVIVETAQQIRADLIVLGSRGRGPISSMILGSVSAEVADHAPCPVLVARQPACRRAIVALDGTPMTDRVVDTVGELGFLRDAHVEVVSVGPSVDPGPGVMLSGAYGMPIAWYEEGVDAARRSLEGVASTAAHALRARGLDATWAFHQGDPAVTIIETAQRTGAELIVVGTHGRTGMTRLLLGSVARNVLLHAHASVLVVRDAAAGAQSGPTPEMAGAER